MVGKVLCFIEHGVVQTKVAREPGLRCLGARCAHQPSPQLPIGADHLHLGSLAQTRPPRLQDLSQIGQKTVVGIG